MTTYELSEEEKNDIIWRNLHEFDGVDWDKLNENINSLLKDRYNKGKKEERERIIKDIEKNNEKIYIKDGKKNDYLDMIKQMQTFLKELKTNQQ